MRSSELGGSVRGAIVSNKCAIQQSFGTTFAYKACLNAEYRGVEGSACYGASHSSSSSNSASSAIESKFITVRGGDPDSWSEIFNAFEDKESDFGGWIAQLNDHPYIVGGNAWTIHSAIKQALKIGNHKLGATGVSLSDDEWQARTDAMEKAYDDRVDELDARENGFSDGECEIDCNGQAPDAETCVCECAIACCPFETDAAQFGGWASASFAVWLLMAMAMM